MHTWYAVSEQAGVEENSKDGKENRKGTQEDMQKKMWEGREWKEAQRVGRTVLSKEP
jgi:hypothetical protein